MSTSPKGLRKNVWFFPFILTICLVLLTAFKISGSSVGIYHQIIYGSASHDPNLILGHPQPIRSDEWLGNTQLTIAQSVQGFPQVNQNIGSGHEMSLSGDVPYKDWSAVFRPQNLAFFVIPLEYAFAFKWWLLLYLVIISCYFFTLRILPGRQLFAVLFSLAVGLSPFLFWWYQTGTLACTFYGFFIAILGIRIIKSEPVRFLKNKKMVYSYIANGLLLTYLLSSFALILYPPFQVPIATAVLFLLLGYLLNSRFNDKAGWESIGKKTAVFALSLLVSVSLVGLFIVTRKAAVDTYTATVYPGARVVSSGHINYLSVFDSFLQPQLQSQTRGGHFFNNQSESSNFILLSPFLILPAMVLTGYEFVKKRRLDWVFVMVQLCVLVFFARVFLPFGNSFYKLLFLQLVPHERLLIGMGFVNILLILLFIKKLRSVKLNNKIMALAAVIYTLACLVIVSLIGFHISHLYPLFISYTPKIIFLAAAFCGIIFLLLIRQATLAAILLLIFSFISIFKINPLYQGLGWIKNNDLFSSMRTISKPGDTWVAANDRTSENFGLLANRDSISGVQPYPDLRIWSQADPANSHASDIYNRYAHVLFISNPPFSEPLRLVNPDFFEVGLSCSRFITSNVDFVLNTSPISLPCLHLKDKVNYPATTFFLYRVAVAS